MATHRSQPSLKLTVPEVLASTRSLYADDLKAFGRVLLKRLRERAAASSALNHGLPIEMVDPESMPKIDPKRLRKICEMCPQLHVHSEEGREFSVVLIGQPCSILDVCSPHDPYPQQMWQEAAAYFQHLSNEEMILPGGRYACARELMRRGLPFLAEHSLGQVCHIVQLAITQKRILGYLEGQLVPYQHSDEWIKEQCAFHQQPICAKPGAESMPVASWEEARERLWELLMTEHNPEPGTLTLSNVKRLFRARFQLELSETALGHSRLFDLLRDVRFRDVCVLQAHKNGQLLVKRADGPQQVPLQAPSVMGALTPPQVGYPSAAPQVHTAGPDVWSSVYMGSVSYPSLPMQMNSLPPPLSALRQVQIDFGMERHWHGLSTGVTSSGLSPKRGQEDESGQSTDAATIGELSSCSSDESERPARPSLLEAQARAIRAEEEDSIAAFYTSVAAQDDLEVCHVVKNTFIDIPSPTSVGARRRLRSVPRDMGLRCEA